MTRLFRASVVLVALAAPLPALAQQNIIVFVADGLRAAAVSPERAPTFANVRDTGVNFANSHSLWPTITTANASVIASGHYLGDTGDLGNTFYTGFPVVAAAGTVTPFIQDNQVLTELNSHHGGNFIAERSMMQAAREKGYLTAALGKVGPVGIHDLTQLDGKTTIFFDDDTGKKNGIELRPDVVEMLKKAGLPLETPGRAQRSETPGKTTNIIQQKYYRDIVTKVLLPHYKETGKPFMLLYWSSDPDGTQHSQRDSLNELVPGINGPTSLAAIKVADEDLAAIMATLKELGLDATTNIFVTADHGFSTISKQSKTSPSAKLKYERVPEGQMPPGFLAIDLAEALGLPLHEPSFQGTRGRLQGRQVSAPRERDPRQRSGEARHRDRRERRQRSDLFPAGQREGAAPKVVQALLAQDYTSGIFVHDDLGSIPGTLPLSAVGLKGGARTPTPSIVVNFRSETTGCDQPLFCSVTVIDGTLMQGQGHHGSFSRADTANFMAAIGPAFKKNYLNAAPVSNADIAPTLAQMIGVTLEPVGKLRGRVISEALLGGAPVQAERKDIVSAPGDGGLRTIVNLQYVGHDALFRRGGISRTHGGADSAGGGEVTAGAASGRAGLHVEIDAHRLADRRCTVLAQAVLLVEPLVFDAAPTRVIDVIETHLAVAHQQHQLARPFAVAVDAGHDHARTLALHLGDIVDRRPVAVEFRRNITEAERDMRGGARVRSGRGLQRAFLVRVTHHLNELRRGPAAFQLRHQRLFPRAAAREQGAHAQQEKQSGFGSAHFASPPTGPAAIARSVENSLGQTRKI